MTAEQQERLFGLYHYLHHRIHSSARPLKILYHVGQYETLLGWVRLLTFLIQDSHKLGKSWKTFKITKKSFMHGKIMEFDKPE